MSMLAGPRRKQKIINLRAKNSAWSNDNNKFGQRMLEKMGWSSGKGLGANENGIVEHVVAKYKNDEKGLGYEDKNDQWTKHENDFDALLANLSNASSDEPILHSGVSLETKSKKSKTRVHYHKFTRGKDLSRYSEKDLANVFGKKSFKNEVEDEQPLQVEIKVTEQVFTEKGSMDDYFKNKLTALKSKALINQCNGTQDDYSDCGFQGFSGTNNEIASEISQGFEFQPLSSCYTLDSNISTGPILDLDSTCIVKKSKKKKKSKIQDIELTENVSNIPVLNDHKVEMSDSKEHKNETLPNKIKKSKKKKYKEDELSTNYESKEDKLNKKQMHDYAVGYIQEQILDQNDNVPKKKKKRKQKEKNNEF